MKILVTGAAGTLGSAVVAHLRSLGWSVRAHDLVPLDPAQADEVVTGDLRDPGQVLRDLEGHARELLAVQVLGDVPAELHVTPERDARVGTETGATGGNQDRSLSACADA